MRSHHIHIHIVHPINTHVIQSTRHQSKPGKHNTNNRIPSHDMSPHMAYFSNSTYRLHMARVQPPHGMLYHSNNYESTHFSTKEPIHKPHPHSHGNATIIQAPHLKEVNNMVPSCHQTTTIPRIHPQPQGHKQFHPIAIKTSIQTHCSTFNTIAYNTDPFNPSKHHSTHQDNRGRNKEK